MASSPQARAKQRLDSWKAIAAFFVRDERTVRRWEIERGLPVHRVPGSGRGVVYAFTDELEEWLREPEAQQKDPIDTERGDGGTNADHTAGENRSTEAAASVHRRSWIVPWLVAGGLALAVLVAVIAYRETARFMARAAESQAGLAGEQQHTPSPEAQDLYLKGRFAWNKRTPESLNQAVDYFTQAIVRDPAYAEPYIGLADCYNLLREFSVMPPSEAYPRALAAARKAAELAPNSSEAHTSLAFPLFWWNLDIKSAMREYNTAIALDPNNARAHHWYATFLVELGRFPEAMAEIARARQLDPSSTAIMTDKAFILMTSGKDSEALALLKQVEAADPNFSEAHHFLSSLYLNQEEYASYFEEVRAAIHLMHDRDAEFVLAAQEKGLATGGRRGLQEATLHAHQRLYSEGRRCDFALAEDYAELGNKAEAMRHLETAYANHDPGLASLLINVAFNGMRHDAAFQELVARVGLAAPGK